MPRGRPRKKKEDDNAERDRIQEKEAEEIAKPVVTPPAKQKEDPDERLNRLRQKEFKKKEPVIASEVPSYDPLYQKLFEAPDGTLIIGDKGADRIWYRTDNKGGGMFINPRREVLSPDEVARKQLLQKR